MLRRKFFYLISMKEEAHDVKMEMERNLNGLAFVFWQGMSFMGEGMDGE